MFYIQIPFLRNMKEKVRAAFAAEVISTFDPFKFEQHFASVVAIISFLCLFCDLFYLAGQMSHAFIYTL